MRRIYLAQIALFFLLPSALVFVTSASAQGIQPVKYRMGFTEKSRADGQPRRVVQIVFDGKDDDIYSLLQRVSLKKKDFLETLRRTPGVQNAWIDLLNPKKERHPRLVIVATPFAVQKESDLQLFAELHWEKVIEFEIGRPLRSRDTRWFLRN